MSEIHKSVCKEISTICCDFSCRCKILGKNVQEPKLTSSYSHIWFHVPRTLEVMSCSAERTKQNIILIRWENSEKKKDPLKMKRPPFQVCDSQCCKNDWKKMMKRNPWWIQLTHLLHIDSQWVVNLCVLCASYFLSSTYFLVMMK